MERIKYLSRIDWFSGLSEEELRRLDVVTPIHTHGKGAVVASPYLEAKVLYLVKSGKVRIYKLTEEGKELTLDILRTGHVFGEMTSFKTGSHMYAVTMEESIICEIDRQQFHEIISKKSELALKYIDIVTARLTEVEEMLEYMAYGSVRKRLLFLLNKLLGKFGSNQLVDSEWVQLEIGITHQELASMTGSLRETVTSILSQLVSEGIVRKEGIRGNYWIHQRRLQDALSTCR
ncbi:Crp/Fnr family transcriptional regulator [Paenibacillus caui]|uniref:Crp/Fnr family transcriptional regulator n=1 Tax=Paenibacillus caui TaxID=2873927 RepID=UPI001CAA14EE|nr:Crp/Fnr family transcriptional regulator [Paenibacillus caui]